MGRLVRRSLTPRIARSISASVVPVNLAVFSLVERSKTGVQVSAMRTEQYASIFRPRMALTAMTPAAPGVVP